MIYVISPYTKTDHEVTFAANARAVKALQALTKQPVYSPVVYGHSLDKATQKDESWAWWMEHCIGMLKQAKSAVVLPLQGWRESAGLDYEMEFCRRHSTPYVFARSDYMQQAVGLHGFDWTYADEAAEQSRRTRMIAAIISDHQDTKL